MYSKHSSNVRLRRKDILFFYKFDDYDIHDVENGLRGGGRRRANDAVYTFQHQWRRYTRARQVK